VPPQQIAAVLLHRCFDGMLQGATDVAELVVVPQPRVESQVDFVFGAGITKYPGSKCRLFLHQDRMNGARR
jgi:hypothetical protein